MTSLMNFEQALSEAKELACTYKEIKKIEVSTNCML